MAVRGTEPSPGPGHVTTQRPLPEERLVKGRVLKQSHVFLARLAQVNMLDVYRVYSLEILRKSPIYPRKVCNLRVSFSKPYFCKIECVSFGNKYDEFAFRQNMFVHLSVAFNYLST